MVAARVLREVMLLATLLGGITILVGVWMVNRPQPVAPRLQERA
jgi:drug/metabolite transporter (DMT)-like permease